MSEKCIFNIRNKHFQLSFNINTFQDMYFILPYIKTKWIFLDDQGKWNIGKQKI